MKRLLSGNTFEPKFQLMRSLLDDERIPYEVRNEGSSIAMGEIPYLDCMPEIWVLNDDDFSKAKELLSNLA
jgi:hypothetical protein